MFSTSVPPAPKNSFDGYRADTTKPKQPPVASGSGYSHNTGNRSFVKGDNLNTGYYRPPEDGYPSKTGYYQPYVGNTQRKTGYYKPTSLGLPPTPPIAIAPGLDTSTPIPPSFKSMEENLQYDLSYDGNNNNNNNNITVNTVSTTGYSKKPVYNRFNRGQSAQAVTQDNTINHPRSRTPKTGANTASGRPKPVRCDASSFLTDLDLMINTLLTYGIDILNIKKQPNMQYFPNGMIEEHEMRKCIANMKNEDFICLLDTIFCDYVPKQVLADRKCTLSLKEQYQNDSRAIVVIDYIKCIYAILCHPSFISIMESSKDEQMIVLYQRLRSILNNFYMNNKEYMSKLYRLELLLIGLSRRFSQIELDNENSQKFYENFREIYLSNLFSNKCPYNNSSTGLTVGYLYNEADDSRIVGFNVNGGHGQGNVVRELLNTNYGHSLLNNLNRALTEKANDLVLMYDNLTIERIPERINHFNVIFKDINMETVHVEFDIYNLANLIADLYSYASFGTMNKLLEIFYFSQVYYLFVVVNNNIPSLPVLKEDFATQKRNNPTLVEPIQSSKEDVVNSIFNKMKDVFFNEDAYNDLLLTEFMKGLYTLLLAFPEVDINNYINK